MCTPFCIFREHWFRKHHCTYACAGACQSAYGPVGEPFQRIRSCSSDLDQYLPCYKAFEHPLLDRRITTEEFVEAVKFALEAGLTRLDSVTV